MQPWKVVVLAVAPASGLLLIAILLFFKYVLRRRTSQNPNPSEIPTGHGRFYVEMQYSGKDSKSWEYPPKKSTAVAATWLNKRFLWINNPSLMADALERGWTAFALSSSSFPLIGASARLLNSSTKGSMHDPVPVGLPEVTWEIGPATELMQLIRFNPRGLTPNPADAPVQILHSALPVPGPAFGTVSFPQEAYFEIAIVAMGSEHRASFGFDHAENEEVTLIPKLSPAVRRSESINVGEGLENKGKLDSGRLLRLKSYIENKGALISSHHIHLAGTKEQLRHDLDVGKGNQSHVMAIGLTVEAPQPLGLPGTYVGSVGLHSNGQVFLNGHPHVERSESVETKRIPWAVVNNTLGCGFDPSTSKVFFTLNGERVWELIGSNGMFEQPLYVSIGSNYDATVMVNFGQGPFLYIPANSQRTPHPGSQLMSSRSITSGKVHEESHDLFSMGTIDFLKILGESENGNYSQDLQHHSAFSEAESDLFEIVLEGRNLR